MRRKKNRKHAGVFHIKSQNEEISWLTFFLTLSVALRNCLLEHGENEMKHLFLVTTEIMPEVFLQHFVRWDCRCLFETVSATSPGTKVSSQSASLLWTAYVTASLTTPMNVRGYSKKSVS